VSPAKVGATPSNALRPIGSQGASCADKEAGTVIPMDLRRWAPGKRVVEVSLEGSDLFRTCWKELLTRDATRSNLP